VSTVKTYADLVRAIDVSDRPVGWHVVAALDIAFHGPITRNTLARYACEPTVEAMTRLDPPRPPGDWIDHAACRGKRMFYDCNQAQKQRLSYADLAFEKEALAICAGCPVLVQCRTWAMQDVDPATDHVAGGLTPRQRHDRRKGRPAYERT